MYYSIRRTTIIRKGNTTPGTCSRWKQVTADQGQSSAEPSSLGFSGKGTFYVAFNQHFKLLRSSFIYLFLVFSNYSWFTRFCQVLLHSKGTQSYIYIHSFSPIILPHHKWLDTVPCATPQEWVILKAINITFFAHFMSPPLPGPFFCAPSSLTLPPPQALAPWWFLCLLSWAVVLSRLRISWEGTLLTLSPPHLSPGPQSRQKGRREAWQGWAFHVGENPKLPGVSDGKDTRGCLSWWWSQDPLAKTQGPLGREATSWEHEGECGRAGGWLGAANYRWWPLPADKCQEVLSLLEALGTVVPLAVGRACNPGWGGGSQMRRPPREPGSKPRRDGLTTGTWPRFISTCSLKTSAIWWEIVL